MCGIAGIYHLDRTRPADGVLLQAMCDALAHRGPDDEGQVRNGHMAIGARRLSIIGVSTGHQPIPNEDRTIWVVQNGEIYNYLELRARLAAKGHTFRTETDTECIAHLYEEYGEECVHHLRGMFAFAVLDIPRQRLFVGRDRLGIKPLFYTVHGGRVLFASEIKAILRDPTVSREIDLAALDAYFAYGYIPSPLTIFKAIRKLDAGHVLRCTPAGATTRQYWDVEFAPERGRSEEGFAREFLELLDETVRMHLVSEVPLGAFLSGGVDSGLLVALMSHHLRSPTKTFTMGFGGDTSGYLDERSYAARVARRYGTEHHELEVQPDLGSIVDAIVQAFDEPFADDSVVPSFYICKLARQHVTVALTGLGGDELFAGYDRYVGLALSEWYQTVPQALRRSVIQPIVRKLPEACGNHLVNHAKRFVRGSDGAPADRYRRYLYLADEATRLALYVPDVRRRIDPAETDELASRYFRKTASPDPVDQALYQDLKMYLPDDILALSDRLSMHHSLEIRVPFVDHRLVELAARIPASLKLRMFRKKHLLKKIAADYLPADVLNHRKQGFASPMASWLRSDLRAYARDLLAESRLCRHGLLDPGHVRRLLDEHLERKESHDKVIFALMMFQKWYESTAESLRGSRS